MINWARPARAVWGTESAMTKTRHAAPLASRAAARNSAWVADQGTWGTGGSDTSRSWCHGEGTEVWLTPSLGGRKGVLAMRTVLDVVVAATARRRLQEGGDMLFCIEDIIH